MTRLIDADALRKLLEEHAETGEDEFDKGYDLGIQTAIEMIDNAPTVEERPTGEWYYSCQNGWHCSICHESVKDMPTVMSKANFAFCPVCGAKMMMESDGR